MTAGRAPMPGLDCITAGHLWVNVQDVVSGVVVLAWCPWCGTGVSSSEHWNDDTVTALAWLGTPTLQDNDWPRATLTGTGWAVP